MKTKKKIVEILFYAIISWILVIAFLCIHAFMSQ